MAWMVSEKVRIGMTKFKGKAGKQILDIITSGMYSDPLMVIREFVQNATDSIDEGVKAGLLTKKTGKVLITIGGVDRSITVEDNGVGVPSKEAKEVLCSVAVSTKGSGYYRGFRGIGRLGGVGYCDEVIFESRETGATMVDVAIWDAKFLRQEAKNAKKESLVSLIERGVSFNRRAATNEDPTHFFRVKMQQVHRFHRDELMVVPSIRKYIAQVAPVPFNSEKFMYAGEVEENLKDVDGYQCYNIYVNDEQVFKPHSNSFQISGDREDEIRGVEFVEFKNSRGDLIGNGWFAITDYLASLPPRVEMRGVRVRQGNIEIGDEDFLAAYYSEERFAKWHVGEIHLNYSLRVNARRDGFEETSDYEAFLERVGLFTRHLSFLCRNSSKERSQRVNLEQKLDKAHSLITGAFFVSEEHKEYVITEAKDVIQTSGKMVEKFQSPDGLGNKVSKAKKRLQQFEAKSISIESLLEGRKLRHIPPKQLLTEILTNMVDIYDEHKSAETLISALVKPYIRG